MAAFGRGRLSEGIKSHGSAEKYLPQILEAVECAKKTGEPVVRHMEYVFPGQGMEKTMNQFMIGDKLLVAPVMQKGVTSRMVQLPRGMWKLEDRIHGK